MRARARVSRPQEIAAVDLLALHFGGDALQVIADLQRRPKDEAPERSERVGLRCAAEDDVSDLVGLALAATRLLQSLLFGTSATDAATFAGGALLLIAIAAAASAVPALRASRVDPLLALRDE